jgi:hypothetical protein
MQLPSIDRTPNVRPSGADLASSGANRVIPIAPVNPSVNASPAIERTPGVVNMVNPALKAQSQPNEGEPVFTSVPDPMQKSSKAAAEPRDWTIHRPAAQKVENPPPKPISQVLMDHLRTMWTASASAIQVEQAKNQITPPEPASPTQVPGDLAKEILTYQPAKIKKTENI